MTLLAGLCMLCRIDFPTYHIRSHQMLALQHKSILSIVCSTVCPAKSACTFWEIPNSSMSGKAVTVLFLFLLVCALPHCAESAGK